MISDSAFGANTARLVQAGIAALPAKAGLIRWALIIIAATDGNALVERIALKSTQALTHGLVISGVAFGVFATWVAEQAGVEALLMLRTHLVIWAIAVFDAFGSNTVINWIAKESIWAVTRSIVILHFTEGFSTTVVVPTTGISTQASNASLFRWTFCMRHTHTLNFWHWHTSSFDITHIALRT